MGFIFCRLQGAGALVKIFYWCTEKKTTVNQKKRENENETKVIDNICISHIVWGRK